MSTTCPEPIRQQRGFAIVAAIFILVVLAALAGFVVSVSSAQHLGFAQDIQGARAYQAARAGMEWGAHQWLAPTPDCTIGNTTLNFTDTDLSGFTVTVSRSNSSSGGNQICDITATAMPTGVAIGAVGYVERQVRAIIEGNS